MHRPSFRTARGVSRPGAAAALVLTLSLFAFSRPALALQPTVVDGADILSPETVDKANATIRQIKRAFKKDVMVETYPIVPKEMEADLQKKGKEPFYAEWVLSRARALDANGVFILIVKSPGRLQIEVGQKTRREAFTLADRNELRLTMVKSFQNQNFDQGVLDGLEFILRRMERNTGIPAGNPPTVGHPPVGPAGVGGTGTTTAPTPATVPTSAPTTAPTTAQAAPTRVPATGPATSPATDPATAPTQGEGDF